jgi:hypothetical protein
MGGGSKGKIFEFTMIKQLKSNYALLPIVLVGCFGASLSAFAIIRTLSRSPDVSINRVGNPRPYERLLTEDNKPVQYKYFSTLDYKKLQIERPSYEK